MVKIYNGDFRDGLSGHYKMLFADPPDNIGLDYDGYYDSISKEIYYDLIRSIFMTIKSCDILWVSINPNHINLAGSILHTYSNEDKIFGTEYECRWLMQHVSFGYNMKADFSRCFRPLIRIMRKGTKTYPDAIRIESERQKIGDKRADPRGKIPPDVWAVHRVTGNSKQRRRWHNTQLGEALYERCLDFSCVPGDRVADLCMGTGTMARSSEGRGLDVELFDISEYYCGKVAEEFGINYEKVKND